MEVKVYDMEGSEVSTVELPARIFEAPINVDMMHQAYVRQMASARLGTHKTKTRGEARGGGRKPWRQKGTGRARHGTIRSPIWVGGGKVHTPRPRSYRQKMPKKMRRAALRAALSTKAAENQIVVIENLELDAPKTQLMAEALVRLVGDGTTALVLIPEKNERYHTIVKSLRNLKSAKTLHASYLNIRDLLGYDKIVIPVEALDVISAYLG